MTFPILSELIENLRKGQWATNDNETRKRPMASFSENELSYLAIYNRYFKSDMLIHSIMEDIFQLHTFLDFLLTPFRVPFGRFQ